MEHINQAGGKAVMERKAWTFLMGFLCGMALLSGSYATATTALTAHPTTQTFYLKGERISLTAYLIGGSNYVRFRDIGRAADFGVEYDAATNSVYIDPDAHYEQKTTAPAPAAGITEESVQSSLAKLRETYPTGTVFPIPYRSASNGPYSRGIYCSGWATLCSDAAFGNLPWRRIDSPTWNQIRPGDIVEYKNEESYHAVVVLDKTADYIKVTESGTNNKAIWGGQYFKWWLEEQPRYILYTRYPN